MLGRWASRLAVKLLSWSKISNEDRQLLTAALIDNLGALPLRARITTDETGTFFVDKRPLTIENSRKIHESSKSMLNNYARRFVREQVTFMAIQKGVHENTSPEQGLFAKAALWFYQEEDELYRTFAQIDIAEESDGE